MKDVIELLNNLQVGDLVWWSDRHGTVIGIVTKLKPDLDGQYLWRADFPQDGEHCYWSEDLVGFAEDLMLGVLWKSEI